MYTTSNEIWDPPFREKMLEHLEPLFVNNNVTLCLWGHVHRYERFCPLNNFTCGAGYPVHIVIGMGGQDWQPRSEHPDVPVFPQPKMSLYRGGEFGYTRLIATKDKLTLSYVGNHDGEVHDMVEILATGEALSGGDIVTTTDKEKITDKTEIKEASGSSFLSQLMIGAGVMLFGAVVGFLIGFLARGKKESDVSWNRWIPVKTEESEIGLTSKENQPL